MRRYFQLFLTLLLFSTPLFSQHTLSLSKQLCAAPGDTITVPVILSLQSPNTISAFGFQTSFPHDLLSFVGTSKENTLTADWTVSQGSEVEDGVLRIGGYHTTPISTSGWLIRVLFAVRATAAGGDSLRLFNLVDGLAGAQVANGFFHVDLPPVIGLIPDQKINEGETFPPLVLTDYATDPDTAAETLGWSFVGNKELEMDFRGNTVFARPPHADWFGAETITFTVWDNFGLSDSADVLFTVENVNDAPVLKDIPDMQVRQGEFFPPLSLDEFVTDIDDAKETLEWRASGWNDLLVKIGNHVLLVVEPGPTWAGSETGMITVTDPGGLFDTTTVKLTINWPEAVAGKPIPPATFELRQNFPNPFNSSTLIEFALPRDTQVVLEVYDTLGRCVAELVNERLPAGQHAVTFAAGELPSGIYLYQLHTAKQTLMKKMMFIK